MSRSKQYKLSIVGLATSALIAAAFLTSVGWTYGYADRTLVVCSSGVLFFGGREPIGPPPGWYFTENISDPRILWLPELYGEGIGVPLWIPFVVIVVSSLVGVRRCRGHPPPHCQKCGYNLTGNVSGVCPECGRPIGRGPESVRPA